MKFTSFLSVGIFILLALLADASHVNYFSLRNAHLRAKAHTHSLARDLRLAFGGTLLPRSNYQGQQAIYCKAGGNSSTGTNATSATSATSTSTATAGTSTASPTVSASPWKLAESHVCNQKLVLFCQQSNQGRSKELTSLTGGLSSSGPIQQTVRVALCTLAFRHVHQSN